MSIGQARADAGGAWSLTGETLADGQYVVTARQVDAAGNTSAAGAGIVVVIDTRVDAPTGLVLRNDTAPAGTTGLENDRLTDQPSLRIAGTAEAGATIELREAGVNLDLTFDQTAAVAVTPFTPSEHVQNIGIVDLMTAGTVNATINGSNVFTGAAAVAGYGNQANTLRFDLQTLLDIGPVNQFNAGSGWGPLAGSIGGAAVHQLVVDGDAADKVNWSTVTDAVVATYGAGAWTKAGSVSHADGSGNTQTYDLWNFASAGNSGAAAAVYAQLILDSDITRLKDSATTSAGTW